MGLFSSKKEGSMMDMIRCDEQEFLIWKWRPEGNEANSTNKENAIRWGSSLRVKDGEVAVFVYKQKDGTQQEFIEGPFYETIKTANSFDRFAETQAEALATLLIACIKVGHIKPEDANERLLKA